MKDSTTPIPATAGEPEMPANAAYWWSPKDGAMAGTWSSNTGPHPDWDVTHYFTTDQLRAYGDARAEHARRVAMEDAALIVDAEEDNAREERYHPGLVGALSACAAAIRAAAPPQGAPEATQFDPAVPTNDRLRSIAKQARDRNGPSDTTIPAEYVLEGWREAEKNHGIHPAKKSQPQGEQT